MTKDINENLNNKLYECNKHIEKLKDTKEYIKDIMPLTIETYSQIDKIHSKLLLFIERVRNGL